MKMGVGVARREDGLVQIQRPPEVDRQQLGWVS